MSGDDGEGVEEDGDGGGDRSPYENVEDEWKVFGWQRKFGRIVFKH